MREQFKLSEQLPHRTPPQRLVRDQERQRARELLYGTESPRYRTDSGKATFEDEGDDEDQIIARNVVEAMQSGRGMSVDRAPVTRDEQEDQQECHHPKQLAASKDAELAESTLSSSDSSSTSVRRKLESLSGGSGDRTMLLPSIGEDMEYEEG